MRIGNPSPLAREFMEKGRSENCPIIDMHGHWGPFLGGYIPSVDPKKLRRSMERCGCKQLVSSSHQALFSSPDQGNAWMQEAIDENSDFLSGYWAVNPNYLEQVSRAPGDFEKSRGFVGFKFFPDYHTYPVTGSQYEPVLKYANQRELLILVHTWGKSAFDSPQQMGEVAAKYPNVRFLMAHCGFGDFEASAAVARDCPHAYLELTCVYVSHDFPQMPVGSGSPVPFMSVYQVNGIIEYQVETAGSEKVVFGTDMPWYSQHYAAGSILFARISDEDRHNILHRNAERLLGEHLKE